jgi:hypothetical protein
MASIDDGREINGGGRLGALWGLVSNGTLGCMLGTRCDIGS